MAPKSKPTSTSAPAASNGAAAAPKAKSGPKHTPSQTGNSTPALHDEPEVTYGSKPDKEAHDAEQDTLKKDIEVLQIKLTAVREKIGSSSKGGPGNDKRAMLRAELDELRSQQSGNKSSRSKILDQLKALQDNIQKKIKDLNAAKAKTPFKTVADIDAHIKNLDKQVESGNLKIAEEKRALLEISQCKRTRKTVEAFQADQDSIEANRLAIEDLRKQLDDPASKAVSERFDTIKAELDEIKKEGDEAYAGRNKLFEERDTLQNEINKLFNAKRESAQKYREASDRHRAKVSEDRARKAERARAQRAEEEAAKKLEIAERLREEASVPAYQFQIEDCQTLIDYFSGKKDTITTYKSTTGHSTSKAEVAGVAPLELRMVETEADKGMVARKKKGDDDENYFVSGKAKKAKKGGAKDVTPADAPSTPSATGSLNVPLPTLSALLSLSITPPASQADVPRVVEDLKTKKTWYEANQDRQTKDNVAKAEANIKKLAGSKGPGKIDDPPVNGTGEYPAEPVPTPAVSDLPQTSVEVDNRLKEVEEETEA